MAGSIEKRGDNTYRLVYFCGRNLDGSSARHTKTVSDNEKYTFRTWLLRLGLIGDEFKTARHHLLKNLDGNIAWKDPAQAERQKERLAQKRASQLNDTVQNTNENININEPESETADVQNEDSSFVMSM